MSNITTAGNLSVSLNTTIGGNCNISGNLIPSGNVVITGGFYSSGLATYNGTTQYNGTVYFGTGQSVYLSSCPLYISGDTNSYLSYVGGANQIRLAGNLGGSIGYISSGTYTSSIYWNNANQVGINTSSPASTLDVNGNINTNSYVISGRYVPNTSVSPDIRFYTGSAGTVYINNDSTGNLYFNESNTVGSSYFRNGNVYVGNTASSLGTLIVQSGIASTSTTTGSFQVQGGTSITGNLYVGATINSVTYGLNYSVLPTFTSSKIGYNTSSITTLGSTTLGTYTYSTASLPIGVYLFTYSASVVNSSAAANTFRFGLSNSGGTFTTNYNYTIVFTANQSNGSCLSGILNVSAAAVQYYSFTIIATITSATLNFTVLRIA